MPLRLVAAMTGVAEKLAALRAEMAALGLDAYLVEDADPHGNELVVERFCSRQWLSGFAGSAGTLLVTKDWAGLWTDSRYYEAAEAALAATEIELMRASEVNTPSLETWLREQFGGSGGSPARFGFAADLVSSKRVTSWQKSLRPAGLELCAGEDLIEQIWADRPAMPRTAYEFVPRQFVTESASQKLTRVREKMASAGVESYLLGRSDEVCWLWNLRGRDLPASPAISAYSLITETEARFYLEAGKLDGADPAGLAELERAGVRLCDHGQLAADLAALAAETRLLLIPEFTSHGLAASASQCEWISQAAIVTELKGCKTEAEMQPWREVMVEDGVALVKAFAWLEEGLRRGHSLGEWQMSAQLAKFRAQVADYRSESFEAIVGYAQHGALNHYAVTAESSLELAQENLLLLDSGGNFWRGTSDTTRVLALGEPTRLQQEDYTLVLKALIALMRVEFAEGTTGAQLDGLARQPLWQAGRQFKHGTGHGVGCGLEVHEGPQNITPRSLEPMKLGQVTTVEPGCYRTGEYGIRLENMVHTVLLRETEFGRFFGFENLTWVPFEPPCIAMDLLEQEELAWLNAYHAEVWQRLSPHLSEREQSWLKQRCAPLKKALD